VTPETLRLRAVGGLGLVLATLGVLVVRLAWLQLADAPAMTRAARGQHYSREEVVQAERGRILDRNGQILAATEKVPSVAVDPKMVNDPQRFASLAARDLGISAETVLATIGKGGRFRWLRRQVTDRPAVERLKKSCRDLRIEGLVVVEEPKRVYPLGAFASQVVGFTDRDGKGLEGVEALRDRELAGKNGLRRVLRDATGAPILAAGEPFVAPTDGEDVQLTIDATTQALAEDEANAIWVDYAAKGVTVAAVDVRTGEILALANRPTYDPNDASKSTPDQRRNRFVTDAFEPGSVFKPFVMAAALDAGTVRADERIDTDGGRLKLGGRTIHEDKGKDYGVVTPAIAIARSSNVAIAKIGIELGEERMKSALRLFGFGARTSLRWPGEQAGDLQAAKRWRVSDQLASASFGHAITATPAQILQANATLANRGLRRELRLYMDLPTTEPVRVVGDAAGAEIVPMMEAVLGPGGTAEHARKNCAEFRVAGKTGTAQKLQTGGHVSSFMCFGPAEDPQIAVLVLVDEPRKATYGSVVAAPFALRILRQCLLVRSVDPLSMTAVRAPATAARPANPEVAPR
jgi:cell division protein FtsI/penicillin-binding protein 2